MKLFYLSITRKILVFLILLSVILAGLFFYLENRNPGLITWKIFLATLLGVILIFVLVTMYIFIRPLDKVLTEMEALIAGKPYKRIYTDRIDEIGIMAHFFNQVTKGFGQVSHEIKDRERMIDELEIAAELQRDILPLKSPGINGLQVVAKNKPATELGGDIFNFINSKDKTYIYIGDVTGHGVAAGLIMTMASSLINVFAAIYDSAYEILVHVNLYLKSHVKRAMYLTLVMLSWDQKSEKLTYVGAGHEHILVYRADMGYCESILSGGIALGMVPDNSKLIKEQELVLNDGDFVILYTDGIIEARNSAGEFYGLERLKKSVMEYAPQYSAEGVNHHIALEVSRYVEGHAQDDDMSLIIIKRDKNIKEELVVRCDQSIIWEV